MKKGILIFGLFTILLLIGCEKKQKEDVFNKPLDDIKKPTELMDQFSYIVGFTMGENFKRDSMLNVNYEYLIDGIRLQLGGKLPLLERREMDSIMTLIQEIIQRRETNRLAAIQIQTEKNKQIAFEFLEANKKKEGVITTPTGLQYKVIKEGSGSKPRPEDHVKIHVITKNIQGEILANTYQENEPLMIHLNSKLIRCWFEGILNMKIGSKHIIYSPPELAFGEKGTDKIPGNLVMIYEIELLDFQMEPYPDETEVERF